MQTLIEKIVQPPRIEDQLVTMHVVEKIKTLISPHDTAILFGSRVRGHARRNSDIDILVEDHSELVTLLPKALSDFGLKVSILEPRQNDIGFNNLLRNTGLYITPMTEFSIPAKCQEGFPSWISIPIRHAHWNLRYAIHLYNVEPNRAMKHFAKACLRILRVLEETCPPLSDYQNCFHVIENSCTEKTLDSKFLGPALDVKVKEIFPSKFEFHHDFEDMQYIFQNWLIRLEVPENLLHMPEMMPNGKMPLPA